MLPVLTVAEMRAVDAAAQATTPVETLVERAGTAVAVAAIELMGGAYGRRVVVVAGKGNNGSDGRVAAAVLRGRGARVQLVEPGALEVLPAADLVIDAAYGTGFRGSYQAPAVAPGTRVLAVDIPSGVTGDDGNAAGRVLAADRTVTFAALKPGLLQGDGIGLAGRVSVADIGLAVDHARLHLVKDGDVTRLVPAKGRDGNKWRSAVLVVAGSPGMTGAAGMCARAAFRAGSGMVRLGVPGGDVADSPAAEAVSIALPAHGWAEVALEQAERCKSIVVGPGLGRDPATAAEVRRLVTGTDLPLVVDADGLFALGQLDGDHPLRSEPSVVLTPHDGEYGRLLDSPPGADRVAAARRLAAASGGTALVKGSTTVVADPSGQALAVTAGSPRLATAGTGDVLSGVIGAFLARGVAPLEAAALAAHVHGRASRLGPVEGLMAGDLPDLVSSFLSDLRQMDGSAGD
jgi:ADP-dependent NAD(P)H-hydrate dehydratase / NAD(P)H-hydrate epimerase